MRRVGGALALVLVWSLVVPAPAFAQEDEASAAASSDEEAEELGLLFAVPVPVMAASKSRKADDAGLVAAHVIVISGEEIRAWGWRTLAEVLQGVAEIHIQGARYFPTASIRGMGRSSDYNQRIIVLLDGHVVNDAISDAVGIDLLLPLFQAPALERVEVILGPASAVYGSTAFYGAVNLVTKKPEKWTGGALVEGGSFGHQRVTGWWAGKSAPFARGRGWELQTFASESTANGEVIDADIPRYGYSSTWEHVDWSRNGSAYVRGRVGRVSMTVFGQDYRRGLLPSIYDIPDDRDRFLGRMRGSGAVEARLYDGAEVAVSLKTFANRTQTYQRSPSHVLAGGGTFVYRVFSEEYGGETVAEWRRGRSTLVGSAEYFYQRNAELLQQDYEDPFLETYRSFVDAVDAILRGSVHERIRFERASVEAGVYAESSRIHGTEVAPSLGVTVLPDSRTTVKALYGRGFRRPSFYEYSSLDDFGSLRPELVDSAEIQVRRRIARSLTFTGDVYRAEYRDFLERDEDGDYFNAPRVHRSQGATGGLEVTGEDAIASADVSWLDARDDDGAPLLVSPSWIGHATLAIKMPRRVMLGMRTSIIGPRHDRERQALPTIILGDAALHVPLARGFRANLSVTNLLDAELFVPVDADYHLLADEPMRGRWFFAQLQWER